MISNLVKNNMIILKSINSYALTNKEITKICLLKNEYWKFGLKSQRNWFKNNIKKYDIHNLLFVNHILVGYTALRKRTFFVGKIKNKYLLFDTLIINKKFRGKQFFSRLIMNFNNSIIQQSGLISFLMCENEFINFYKKNNWIVLNKKKFKVIDHIYLTNGMIFNQTKKHKKILFYVNK